MLSNNFPDKKIVAISAEEKENEIVRHIIENNAIPEDVDILLTTSVISDGINILNKNINNVYLCGEYNPLKKMQFIARFRKGVNMVFDIGKYHTNIEDIDIEFEFNKILEASKSLVNVVNDSFEENNFELKQSLLRSIGNELISKVEKQYVPNEETIKFYTMQKLSRLLRDANLLKTFLSEFYNFEPKITELVGKKLEDIKDLIKLEKENEKQILDLILKEPGKWVTGYFNKNGKLKLVKKELKRVCLYSESSLTAAEEALLSKSFVKNTISKIILLKMRLHKENISKEDIERISKQQLSSAYDFLAIIENEILMTIDEDIVKEYSEKYNKFEYILIKYLKEITQKMIGTTMTQKELIEYLTKSASSQFNLKPNSIRNVVKKWVKAMVNFKPAKVNKRKVYKIESIRSIGQFLKELGFEDNKINITADLLIADIACKALDKLKNIYKELGLDKELFSEKVKNFVEFAIKTLDFDYFNIKSLVKEYFSLDLDFYNFVSSKIAEEEY
ncbi:MAG: hypothetical protein H0Z22_07090 [Thermosipho sp. (in: Bacteria)]|nr:hypothetical protein [Thermosipho sp. (in: thermotogales)]